MALDWDRVLNQVATDLKTAAGLREVYRDAEPPTEGSLIPVGSLFDPRLPRLETTLSHVDYEEHTLTIVALHRSSREADGWRSTVKALWNGPSADAKARMNALRELGCVNLFPQNAGLVSLKPETVSGPAVGKYMVRIDFTAWGRDALA